jgi:hypothetical protein
MAWNGLLKFTELGVNVTETYVKRADMDTEGQLLVDLGRAERRLLKARQQRDYYKQRLQYYEKVLSMQPHLRDRYNTYEERIKEIQRTKDLEARCKEQALLIQQLQIYTK